MKCEKCGVETDLFANPTPVYKICSDCVRKYFPPIDHAVAYNIKPSVDYVEPIDFSKPVQLPAHIPDCFKGSDNPFRL